MKIPKNKVETLVLYINSGNPLINLEMTFQQEGAPAHFYDR